MSEGTASGNEGKAVSGLWHPRLSGFLTLAGLFLGEENKKGGLRRVESDQALCQGGIQGDALRPHLLPT